MLEWGVGIVLTGILGALGYVATRLADPVFNALERMPPQSSPGISKAVSRRTKRPTILKPRLEVDRRLREFAKSAPAAESEARALLATMPGMGPVTIDSVLCELGDVRRFRSQRQVVAYAGLAPGIRQSAGRTKQQGITKAGSRLLRWTLVEFAWRIVRQTRRWGFVYERLKQRRGAKRAIVAVARRLLGVLVCLLRTGKGYSLATELAAQS